IYKLHYCYSPLFDLHSFPTRRSSDLRKEVKPLSYQDIEYHKPETKLPKKRPVVISTKNAEESWEHLFTYTFNDYMLARGFAVVYSGGVGTLDSDGYRTCEIGRASCRDGD